MTSSGSIAGETGANAGNSLAVDGGTLVRPYHEWHEDHGDVLWFKWPIEEAPWVGTPLDLGRTVSFDLTVQIGRELHEVEQHITGNTGGWPWAEEEHSFLFWLPLPDFKAIDEAIRDHIRGGPDPFKEQSS